MKQLTFTNIEEMLSELGAKDQGRYLLCKCPDCKVDEAFIYKNNLKLIQCNRAEECGERNFIKYEDVKDVDSIQLKSMKESYPDLSKEQRVAIDWSNRAFDHIQTYAESDTLDNGYRGLSKDIVRGSVIDFQSKDMVNLMFQKTHPLFKKDYRNNSFMSERNLVLPIYGDDNNIERILLRSSINPKAEPKEVQLIMNPSKNARDFFVDVNDNSETVVITEALFDGLSFREIDTEIGFLSLTGSRKTRQINEYLIENKEFFKDKNILFALDGDEAGNEAMHNIIGVVEEHGIGADWNAFNYPDNPEARDPNDFLQYDRKLFEEHYLDALKGFKREKAVERHVEMSY